MARPAASNVVVQWTNTGTGTLSLGSAVPGSQGFPSALSGFKLHYSIEHENGVERESGLGTYTSSGNTLSRDLVDFSTAVGGAPNKQNFTAGTKFVRLTIMPRDLIEDRRTTVPGLTDDINAGYIEGRSRVLNTATGAIYMCRSHAIGAAVWDRINAPITSGGTLPPTSIVTTSYQILLTDGPVRTNTAAAGFQVTAPVSPTDGQLITLEDAAEGGSWSLAKPVTLVTSDGSTLGGNSGAVGVAHYGGTTARWRYNTAAADWGYLVTPLADASITTAKMETTALAAFSDTRPGVVDVLEGLTLVNNFSPPYGASTQTPGQDVASLQGQGSEALLLSSLATAGEVTFDASGLLKFTTSSSAGELRKLAPALITSNIYTLVYAFVPTGVLDANSFQIFKGNHTTGFGVVVRGPTAAGAFIVVGYTAALTTLTLLTIPSVPLNTAVVVAVSIDRTTGRVNAAYNFGSRYGTAIGGVLANWVGRTDMDLYVGHSGSVTGTTYWAGAKEYTSSAIATRAQLEALVRDMEQHAARKIGHGDLALPLLQTVETSAAVPRGIGTAGNLMSAWVSGFGVTGSSPITGVVESHGLATALAVSGSPALQSDGAIRIVCNGVTSSGLLSKNNVLDLLRVRNILVMDLYSDVAGDWNAASLFRAFDSAGGYGFILTDNGIALYTAAATTTSSVFTPKRGRQRIGVYIEFGNPSSFRYISVGRDQNMLSRAPFKVAGTFASATQDPTGQDGLDVWIGEGNLLAGRAGTHDIYGWRLLKGVPAGLSADSIDALLLAEIDKLGRDSDALLRVLPTPVDLTPWLANIDGGGFGLYNQGLLLASTLAGTTHDVAPDHRGRVVPLSNAAGWTLTIIGGTPPGDYYYKDIGGVGGTVVGGATVTLFTMNAAGTGLTGVTSPSLSVLPNGRVWIRIEQNAGTAPIGVAGGDLDVPAIFTDPVTFTDVVKVGTLRGTSRDIGAGATIGAADNGKQLYATATGTATVSAVSTLAPVAGDIFQCTVVNTAAGDYVLDGPGGTNVTLAIHEAATIICRNGGALRVYKSLGTVIS